MDKKKIFEIVTAGIGLFIAAVGALISIPETKNLYGYIWGIYFIAGAILIWVLVTYASLIAPAIKERKNVLWKIEKPKEVPKVKFSIDIHKSSNWNKDNLLVLCIHNESFFREIKNLSVIVAGINKVENRKSDFALNRSVILHENLIVPKMKASMDFPFLEVVKKDNKFVIRAIHQESPNKEIFEHEFGYGEYIIHLVIKQKDTGRDSMAIPIHIKYDGWDKISGEVHEAFPKNLFPMSI